MPAPRPRARSRDLVVRKVPGREEVLVYDTGSHRAYCLDAQLARIWRRCDGKRTVVQLGAGLGADGGALDGTLVLDALESLSKSGLLTEPLASPTRAGRSRRDFLRQASALGLAIAAISVPTMADAASSISDAACAASRPPCPRLRCSSQQGQNPPCFCKLVGAKCTCLNC